MKKFIKYLFMLPLLVGIEAVAAQTTISNAPSTDVIEHQSSYLEAGYSGHFGKYSDGGFQSYGFKALYGLRRNVEIGANLSYTRDGASSPVEFSPNVKWKAYYNENHKFAVSGGAIAFIPVKDVKGSRPSALVYAIAGKEFDFAGGIRITGGVYTTVGMKKEDGNRKGFMIGYEQTLIKKAGFIAEYISGSNRFGYTSVGLSIPFAKKNVFFAGYNFGNTGRGNNWLAVTYGRYF